MPNPLPLSNSSLNLVTLTEFEGAVALVFEPPGDEPPQVVALDPEALRVLLANKDAVQHWLDKLQAG